jgi:hypothetical protein
VYGGLPNVVRTALLSHLGSEDKGLVRSQAIRLSTYGDANWLLIHEFGHQYSADHLSEGYHEALCRLGAGLKKLALEKPEAFDQFKR